MVLRVYGCGPTLYCDHMGSLGSVVEHPAATPVRPYKQLPLPSDLEPLGGPQKCALERLTFPKGVPQGHHSDVWTGQSRWKRSMLYRSSYPMWGRPLLDLDSAGGQSLWVLPPPPTFWAASICSSAGTPEQHSCDHSPCVCLEKKEEWTTKLQQIHGDPLHSVFQGRD